MLLKSQTRAENRAEVPTHLGGAPRSARDLSRLEREVALTVRLMAPRSGAWPAVPQCQSSGPIAPSVMHLYEIDSAIWSGRPGSGGDVGDRA